MRKIYAFMVLAVLLFNACACDFRMSPGGEDDYNAPIQVMRYDRLESRYLTTGDYSALQQMNTDYPIETRTLVEKVLQISEADDPEFGNKFLRFYQDSSLQVLISDVEAEYAAMDDLNTQLNACFKKLRKWIPDIPKPRVYAQIGALEQSIIIGEKLIGICLDKYMGENYPLYMRFYNYQQRMSMTRSYIVPDCLTFYLLSLYPMDRYDSRTQLEKDLHMGKVMWVVNKAMEENFFNTDYTRIVGRYMHRNADTVSIEQLLISNDYSRMTP